MNADNKQEYVKYRIDSAFNAYNAASILAENGFWNSAVNRLYYAVFYAVNALLVQNDIHANSHSGTRSQFTLHYIKTGKLDKKFGKLLAELYDWRQKGDYENIFDYNAESVNPMFSLVLEMIEEIEKKVKNNKDYNN
jgi:uncharacterized protein (UPF0332 family)